MHFVALGSNFCLLLTVVETETKHLKTLKWLYVGLELKSSSNEVFLSIADEGFYLSNTWLSRQNHYNTWDYVHYETLKL